MDVIVNGRPTDIHVNLSWSNWLEIFEKATLHPRATHEISEIIAFVEDLIKKGYAYEVDGDVYYRAKKFPNYGKLSDQNIEQLEGLKSSF